METGVSYIAVMSSRRGHGPVPVLLSLLLCPVLVHCGFAQTSTRCTLSATVVNSATGVGIPHALVSYRGLASGYRFTDAAGGIHVENLPSGPYSLAVSKPGFVSEDELSSRQNVFAMMGQPQNVPEQESFEITPSQTFKNVELKPDSSVLRIKLLPVAAISGTVLDEHGEPLEGLSVQSVAVKASLSGVDYAPSASTSTDDRGRYLFPKLVPGDYLIRLAGEISATHYFAGKAVPDGDHRGMRPVYYPSGDTTAGAFVFHLVPGEQTNADFQQPTERAFDIDGRLTGFVSHAWTQMQLYRDGDRLPVARAYVNLANGQFRVIDVPPGSYTLRAVQYESDPVKWLAAEASVNVTAEPVRDMVVDLAGAASIPVSVDYEAGAEPNGPLFLTLEPQHARQNMRNANIGGRRRPAPEGQEETENSAPDTSGPQTAAFTDVIPDQYRLRVNGAGDGYVASATLGDVDVLHREFRVGAAPGEMRIVVRGDSASLEGQVTSKGSPAVGASVCLIPQDGGDALRCGAGDQAGHYQIQGVAPGDYRVAAWYGLPTIEELQSGLGDVLTVEAGEHRTVSLEAAENPDAAVGMVAIER